MFSTQMDVVHSSAEETLNTIRRPPIFPQKSHPLWWKGFRVKMSEQAGAVNQEMLEQLLAALNAPKKV